MTERKSKRSSAVTKRRLLDETLDKRKGEAEIRKLNNQSKALKELRKLRRSGNLENIFHFFP